MKKFWQEVWKMTKEIHGLRLANVLWFISFCMFVLAILGVLTQSGGIKVSSIVVLGIIVALYFYHFFIELPAKVWERDVKNLQSQLAKWEPFISAEVDRIATSVKGRTTSWDFTRISNQEPYFELFFELTSTCIFPIHLKGVSGFIRVAGNQCGMSPQVSERWAFNHGDVIDVRLRQPITAQTANIILAAKNNNSKLNFDLRDIVFEMEITEPRYESHRPRLTGKEYEIVPS